MTAIALLALAWLALVVVGALWWRRAGVRVWRGGSGVALWTERERSKDRSVLDATRNLARKNSV